MTEDGWREGTWFSRGSNCPRESAGLGRGKKAPNTSSGSSSVAKKVPRGQFNGASIHAMTRDFAAASAPFVLDRATLPVH